MSRRTKHAYHDGRRARRDGFVYTDNPYLIPGTGKRRYTDNALGHAWATGYGDKSKEDRLRCSPTLKIRTWRDGAS